MPELRIGQEVLTRFGRGTVRCIGRLNAQVYVSVPPQSNDLYVFSMRDLMPEAAEEPGGGPRHHRTPEGRDGGTAGEYPLRRTDMKTKRPTSPLALFVAQRLGELGLRQAEFSRLANIDQGLMSRIQSATVTRLSLESALKLARGLSVPPRTILELIGRPDLEDLLSIAAPRSVPGDAPTHHFGKKNQ